MNNQDDRDKLIDEIHSVLSNLCKSEESYRVHAEHILTLIRTATLDAMQAETDEIEKSELWAQMGIPAECHCVYIEKFEEAIDNLRGNDE